MSFHSRVPTAWSGPRRGGEAISPLSTHTNAAPAFGRIHPSKPSAMLGVVADAGSSRIPGSYTRPRSPLATPCAHGECRVSAEGARPIAESRDSSSARVRRAASGLPSRDWISMIFW